MNDCGFDRALEFHLAAGDIAELLKNKSGSELDAVGSTIKRRRHSGVLVAPPECDESYRARIHAAFFECGEIHVLGLDHSTWPRCQCGRASFVTSAVVMRRVSPKTE